MNKKNALEAIGFEFKAINISQLNILTPSLNYEIIKDNKKIISVKHEHVEICIGDNYSITLPSGFDVEYKVNHINVQEKYPRIITCEESLSNTTSLFVLPLIFKNKDECSYINGNSGYLINAYIESDFIKARDNYSVFLLLKFSKASRFKVQEDLLKSNENFVKCYDVSRKYVVYEFSVPEKNREDFDLIVDGKYSKIDKKTQGTIIEFHGRTLESSLLHKIMTKHKDLVKHYEAELGMSMDGHELYKKMDESDILTKDLL